MQQQPDSCEESWLEEQCHREINGQHDEQEREYVRQRDNNLGTVWGAFQDSATAVAQLYRDRSSNIYQSDTGVLWLPFQTAAGTVTTLYKESCDGLKRTSDAAIQCGYQRRTRELADWARNKKRRMIRREDLLAYLAGKPLPSNNPHNNRRSPKPEHHNHSAHHAGGGLSLPYPSSNLAMSTVSATPQSHLLGAGGALGNNPATAAATADGDDLHTFKEALVLRPRGPELFAFVASEIARHCKRPGSPIDDKMDICHYSSKRQRFM